jgi:hypothetical protein
MQTFNKIFLGFLLNGKDTTFPYSRFSALNQAFSKKEGDYNPLVLKVSP